MFTTQTLITFTTAVTLLAMLPGADTMLVLRNVMSRGQKAGLFVSFGACSGVFVHGIVFAFGLSLILQRSATAFTAMKWIGAIYLTYLGVQSLRNAWRNHAALDLANVKQQATRKAWRSYLEGLFSNIINPKVAMFYLAFLPQFINPNASLVVQSLSLSAIYFIVSIIWFTFLTLFLSKMRNVLQQPVFQRGIESIAGIMLIGFGVRLALSKR